MGQPPGQCGVSPYKIPLPGPKYLIMSRISSSDNENLANVSPFLIKKMIDFTCSGEVEVCKKLRNGTVLIKTKNASQADKLLKLTALSTTIKVNISEHKTLNFVKGVIYSNDLRGIPNEEIVKELQMQKVVKVDKIQKKVNDELKETGLIVITFESLSLPSMLYIGYEKVDVRPYIPLPLRCNNCFMFGHIAKICKKMRSCFNCSEEYHINSEDNESCSRPKVCSNCKLAKNSIVNHATTDKSCPIFLKEKEIQAIITLEKVNRTTAVSKYNERQPHTDISYANATSQHDTNQTNITSTTSRANRSLINYSEVSPKSIPDFPQTIDIQLANTAAKAQSTASKDKNHKVKIMPLKTSTRIRRKLKSIAAGSKQPERNSFVQFDTADDSSMDLDNI